MRPVTNRFIAYPRCCRDTRARICPIEARVPVCFFTTPGSNMANSSSCAVACAQRFGRYQQRPFRHSVRPSPTANTALCECRRDGRVQVCNARTDRYEPVTWEAAFQGIAAVLHSVSSPDEVDFYTSGCSSNEAAFLYQLLAREFGTNNFPECSNFCHEPTSQGLPPSIGIGKGMCLLEDFEKADAIAEHPFATLKAWEQRTS